MANKFRFMDWKVYSSAKKVYSTVLKIVHEMPTEHKFEIGTQVARSSLSIALNIAEGSGKSSDKELNRFINISLGSVYETVAAVDILYENKLISEAKFDELISELDSIAGQLGGFKNKIKKSY